MKQKKFIENRINSREENQFWDKFTGTEYNYFYCFKYFYFVRKNI